MLTTGVRRKAVWGIRRKAVWGPRRLPLIVGVLGLIAWATPAFAAGGHTRSVPKAKPGAPSARVHGYKLDDELTRRSNGPAGDKTRVIVTLVPGATLPAEFKVHSKGALGILNGHVLELSNGQLKKLAAHPSIFRVHYDRPVKTHNYRTAVTVGALTVQETLGYTGAGVGIAVIDSGISTFHDDLTRGAVATQFPYGNQRVTKFVDFVNGQTLPYDDNGHGTHVAGIIAGNGYDSRGQKAGIAPNASLVALKVLDAHGQGTISNIIAALDWVRLNAAANNIKVVNMSVGAGVHESYWTDPLTLAAKRVVDMGITVVAAAGNLGKNSLGQPQWGAITAPGNAPWVLTVGASSTNGTLTRNDDTMAGYSSRGPTFVDFEAKPDLVAPGTGTISLAAPGSTFYLTKAAYLLKGNLTPGYLPYLSLSGTSMAAPVVSGTVALMLQANPYLTPNLIKAILQYTAQVYSAYKPLEEGAGFLNTLGAVRYARFMRNAKAGDRVPVQKVWSRRILWGNHMIKGGYLSPRANAWANSIVWGSAFDLEGDNIVWGSACADTTCDNIVWANSDGTSGDNIVWANGAADTDAVVWGSFCVDVLCDNIVWGDALLDFNIVWGNDCGGADCDAVVWGSVDEGDNIVWGSATEGDNIVWGSSGTDTAVWATSADGDVTWGSDTSDAILYPDADPTEPLPSLDLEFGDVALPPDPNAAPTVSPVVGGSTSVLGGGL